MNNYEWLRYLHDLNDYISCIWIWEQIMTLELVAIFEWAFWSFALWRHYIYSTTDLLPHSISSRNTLNLKPFRSRFHYATTFLEATITMSHGTQLHPTQLYCQNSNALNSFKMIQTQNSQFSQFCHHTRPDKEPIRCHGSEKSPNRKYRTT